MENSTQSNNKLCFSKIFQEIKICRGWVVLFERVFQNFVRWGFVPNLRKGPCPVHRKSTLIGGTYKTREKDISIVRKNIYEIS